MADLGKVVITDGGDYSPGATYEKLTFVHYGSNTYMTLRTVTDITPTDDGVNYKLFCRSAELATATIPGTVMPDGVTTEVSADGALSAKTATQSTAGIVKGSAGIKVGADGVIDVNTLFTQATELANIIAGEAIAEVFGKISKAIATTMNLDQNALLKNMLTNIDANDSSKVPTSAFIHTLYERIGMGEELGIGANLTAVVKALNSNLSNIGDVVNACVKYRKTISKSENIFALPAGIYTLLEGSDYFPSTLGAYGMLLIMPGEYGYVTALYIDSNATVGFCFCNINTSAWNWTVLPHQ